MEREIIIYKNYFFDFLKKLEKKEREKMEKKILLLRKTDRIPRRHIKHLRDGLYEFRENLGNNEFRVLFFYDGITIVVLLNGFKKKTQKTPAKEINKALTLKKEYEQSK